MAEAILNKLGNGEFVACSAGSKSVGQVNPYALKLLRDLGYDVTAFKSKKPDEFLSCDLDYVITVCDNANKECPIFTGNAKKIHWGLYDPAGFDGSEEEKYQEFKRIYGMLEKNIKDFVDFLK